VFVDRAPEKLRESGGLVVGKVNRHRPEAARPADLMLDDSDREGAGVWQRIRRAIEALKAWPDEAKQPNSAFKCGRPLHQGRREPSDPPR
jgi:hypothetical protein